MVSELHPPNHMWESRIASIAVGQWIWATRERMLSSLILPGIDVAAPRPEKVAVVTTLRIYHQAAIAMLDEPYVPHGVVGFV